VFTVTINGRESTHSDDVVILKNRVELCRTYAHHLTQSPGTCVAVVHLAVGDEVWAAMLGGEDLMSGGNWSSFSGFLVAESD
jgi:hypothetical protein